MTTASSSQRELIHIAIGGGGGLPFSILPAIRDIEGRSHELHVESRPPRRAPERPATLTPHQPLNGPAWRREGGGFSNLYLGLAVGLLFAVAGGVLLLEGG
jgi:hypothetical protein